MSKETGSDLLALTDDAGVVQTSYTYEPFGSTTASGQANGNPLQYTGRENDGIGLYYNRARYYSPQSSRFISEDPIRFGSGDSNLYSYVSNGPLDRADPTGLTPYPCSAGIMSSSGSPKLAGRKDGDGGGGGDDSGPIYTVTYAGSPRCPAAPVPGMEENLQCLASCLKTSLVVTGGSESCGHQSDSRHPLNQAVDFGFGSNPGLAGRGKEVACCAFSCGFGYAGIHSGTHWHLELKPYPGGSTGDYKPSDCGT